MKERDESDYQEDNEVVANDSKRFELYSQILEKEDNITFRIKKNKHRIKLLSNDSLFKICGLSQHVPEENVLFTLYANVSDESEELEEEDNNNKKGIDKLKERLTENDMENNVSNKYNNKLRSKKPKNNLNNKNTNDINEKEDKYSIIVIDKIKPSARNILNNYDLYRITWKNLYKWFLIFPLIILLGLLYFINKDAYGFSFAEIICFILVLIICITSMSGNSKINSEKRVNFRKENLLLIFNSIIGIYILVCTNKIVDLAAYQFLNRYNVLVNCIFVLLIIFCCVLFYLNIKMTDFYYRYSKMIKGTLLSDRD